MEMTSGSIKTELSMPDFQVYGPRMRTNTLMIDAKSVTKTFMPKSIYNIITRFNY